MLEQYKDLISRLEEIKISFLEKINSIDKSNLLFEEEETIGGQIRRLEQVRTELANLSNSVSIEYNKLSSLVDYEILNLINSKLLELRERKIQEETDTPREAYENIEMYTQQYGSNILLTSAMNWIKTQMPPQEVETRAIKFEVAKILDESVESEEGVISVPGEDGEERITYEIVGGEKTVIKKEVIKEPVTQVVRVKSLEA